MGFDNECILNIQSLAGEYFCPVCRLLVYPNEALQSQCTHLYCKPCLTYIVSTTRACPYDGYLVTEADSKPLIESNKALAETIGKIVVHCLYHRSGCTWQGPLSECTSHCAGCTFGNSPVVCNRCAAQIVHRQVQEHAQSCPGVQPQAQQAEGSQNVAVAPGTTAAEQSQATAQSGAPASQAQPSQTVAAPPSGQDQSQANLNAQPQAVAQVAPTPEQWYQQQQQQYQQYYQQYPGYDPYQQHYQHYDPYQQAHMQYQQQHVQAHPPHAPGQHQQQVYMQTQPQAQPPSHLQPQAQTQAQPQPHPQPQPQPQPHTHPQTQLAAQPQMQAQFNQQQQQHPTIQSNPQMQPQTHPPPQGHQLPQPYPQGQSQPQPQPQPQLVQPQPQPHSVQPHLQQHTQMQQYQQPYPQMQHPQPQTQPHTQPQPQPQPQLQHHPHVQPQPQMQPHPQPQPQLPSAHAVTGHQSYPQPQPHHQMLPGAPQQNHMHLHPQQQGISLQPSQHPVQMQSQFPSHQPPQMRPPQSQAPMQPQQPAAMLPGQHQNISPALQQMTHPHASQPGQPIHQHPSMQPPQQQPVSQQQAQQFHKQQLHGHLHHSQSFPGQVPGMVQNQPHQQGPIMQPQVRPQGLPSSLQKQAHAHPSMQQNVPSTHSMQPHQLQSLAGRPIMPNHGVLQQPFPQSPSGLAGAAQVKLMQPIANQPSPNQTYLPRTNIRPQSSFGSQNALLPVSPASQPGPYMQTSALQTTLKPPLFEKQGDSMPLKSMPGFEAEAASQNTDEKEVNGSVTASSPGANAAVLRIPNSESDPKSMDEEKKEESGDQGKSSDLTVKEILVSSQKLERDSELHAHEDGLEEPLIKKMVKEEDAENEPSPSSMTETLDVGPEDVPGSPLKHGDNSLSEVKEIHGAPLQKNLLSQQTENLEGQDVKLQKDSADAGALLQPLPGTVKGSQTVSQASGPVEDGSVQNVNPQGQIHGNESGNMLLSPVNRNSSHQLPRQSVVPTHERMLPHSGYQERDLPQSQFPRPGPGPDENKGLPPAGQVQGKGFVPHQVPVSDQERHHQLPMNYGIPHQQRPPAPERILQQPMHPPSHQMQVPGQPPVHMRSIGHNSLGNLPQQGQPLIPPEHFQPPMAKQLHGSFHPEVPPGGFPGPGSSASFVRGPGHLGPPQRSFETQSIALQGHHSQGHMLPPHVGGPRISHGESIGGPPPGAFDPQGGMIVRGPPQGPEGQMGHTRPTNPLEADMFANKRPGYVDGRQSDAHLPGSAERVPFGRPSGVQSSMMNMNGAPGKGMVGAVQDPSFAQEERFKPFPEEKYRRLPEEGFNSLPEEHFKPFPMEPGRRIIDRREFEEDLKQFPRPAHLEAEPARNFESYFSSSRPLDRTHHGFSHDGSPGPLRMLPPYQSSGSSVHPMDVGERSRPVGHHDDTIGRKTDPSGAHPDFHRGLAEFGRHRIDAFPPSRSPGREYHGISSSRFGGNSSGLGLGSQSRLEDIESREPRPFGERSKSFNIHSEPIGSRFPMLPSHLHRGEIDGAGNMRMGEQIGSSVPINMRSGDVVGPDILPSHLRSETLGPGSLSHIRSGESVGPRNFPSHLRMGEPAGFGAFPSHLRMGDLAGPGNLPSHLRINESIREGNLPSHVRLGEPGLGSSYPIQGYPSDGGFYPGDMEPFDHSRKRKLGSTGWCRICKVDCETVEGLDLHSQTREHQKMAMDMVLSIKQDNAKKQKLSSDDHVSNEDANKSRKANFESRGNRH